ncbi:hypothetical protein [Alterisphingorhabdus coralli]|uniref:Uncharacterized protein n=1 Tax=Alterisphingorhabdus coralli TaxID=3071408 RepID=A0AA97I1K7_9SPHN|nr:hypothetical protein [Parasphingorhabdus sp. SCSIO 66989]WOE76142.1 hypothetical protein RB602_05355 [Parasphingorhabdus sp. SCSIO 66989]
MHKIEDNNGQIVASDVQKGLRSIDAAITDNLTLTNSILQVSEASALPVSTSQGLLRSTTAALNGFVEGREQMARTIKQLSKIQAESNLRTVSFGCPNGIHQVTGSAIEDQANADLADS